MSKLLVNTPNGRQDIVEVFNGGGYFDSSRVIWDERVDGPLPDVTPGGMVREGDALVFYQARMDEHNAAISAVIDPKMQGIEILGVMCSATRNDQNGLTAVALGVTLARMASQTFPDTRFEFENGNSLVVTDDNFDHIYSTWTPLRQSFFAAE